YFLADADPAMTAWWGARERAGGSPGAARHLIASSEITDVRDTLRSIQAPTLVVSPGPGTLYDPANSAFLAQHIPGARLLELESASAFPWVDADEYLDDAEEFQTGSRPSPVSDRVLATILFTDIVGSTRTALELGDAAWAELLERHHGLVRREVTRFQGEEVDTAGRGFFVPFDGPGPGHRLGPSLRGCHPGTRLP